MLLTPKGFELFEHLDRQKTAPTLLASFQRLVLSFGMDGFWIGDPSSPSTYRENRLWGATWPVRWYSLYEAGNYLSLDPVVSQMNAGPQLFRWSSTRVRATPAGKRILEEATEFGLNDGLAFAVFEGAAPVAGVSIFARHYELSIQDESGLYLAAMHFYTKLHSLKLQELEAPPATAKLTRRERECLDWVALGKTDWEISQILVISEQTAHSYIQSAMAKLRARSRAQAVARALALKEIRL